MRRFGLPPPTMSDPKALTRATVDTRFDVDTKQAKLSDVVLALDDTQDHGQLRARPVSTTRATASRSTSIASTWTAICRRRRRTRSRARRTAGDIELPENNTMRLDGNVHVGDLRLAGLQFAERRHRIVLGSGNAELENARAQLYGGDFAGSLKVHAAGDKPGLALSTARRRACSSSR